MKNTITPLGLFALFVMLAAPVLAQPRITEDFSTRIYEDVSSNSAIWDTTTGTAYLHPFEPTLRGVADTPGNTARKIEVQGHHAFVADGYAGVQVGDIDIPGNPHVVGVFDTPGFSYHARPHGDQMYVADHTGGLRVADISDPLNPAEIGSLSLPGVALGLWVEGDRCYVGCGEEGMAVVSIVDPTNPTLVTMVSTPGNGARSPQAHGKHVFITDGYGGLTVIDISDMDAPQVVTNVAGYEYARDLIIDGDYLYMSERFHGLTVYDISDPENPVNVGVHVALGETRSLDMFGDTIYLANDGDGIRVLDMGLPHQPIIRAVIETTGHVYDILRLGEHLLVGDQVPGLQSVEVAQANDPIFITQYQLPSLSSFPVFEGNRMYHGRDDELVVTDLTSVETPTELGSVQLGSGGDVVAVALSGDRAVVVTDDDHFTIVDITDPVSMTQVSQLSINGGARGIALSGNHAILAGWESIEVVNFRDAEAPYVEGGIYSGFSAQRVVVQGNLAVAYGSGSLVQMIDISDPGTPALLGSAAIPGGIFDLEIQGDLIYGSSLYQGLFVVDISDPANPQEVSSWNQNDAAGGLTMVGRQLYMGADNEIAHYSLSNPSYPFRRLTRFSDGAEGHRLGLMTSVGKYLIGLDAVDQSLKVFQVLQNTVDLDRPYISSLGLPSGDDDIVRVRYRAAEEGRVFWNIGVNGAYAIDGHPQDTWVSPLEPGPGLIFNARLGFIPEGGSFIDEVTMEWLYHFAQISQVKDIPDDQGGQVRVEWLRSGHDFIGDETQVTEYAIYRRVDGQQSPAAKAGSELAGASDALLDNILTMNSSGWDYVASTPVLVQDFYSMVVPTLADSTATGGDHDTVFKVVALTATPGVFFASYPDSGSSVDNLAPGVPLGLVATHGPGGVNLVWDEAEEEDFQYFNVYRGNQPGFVPGPEFLVHQTATPGWTDEEQGSYYQVTAVDFAGNESAAAETQFASDTPLAGPRFALQGAVPNPFNPSTRLDFSLAKPGQVQLVIYDLAGRKVRTLVDEMLAEGDHHRRWDGRNQSGRQVASGTYFALLRSGSEVQKKRLMLVK